MNENTPLSGNNGQPDALGNLSNFAKNVFTKENLAKASEVATQKANELRAEAQDGHHSLRLLALLGGVALVVVGALEFTGKLLSLNFVGAIVEIYTFLIGAIVIVLEGKNATLSELFQNRIYKYALFLKFLWGRGGLYFVVGTLQLYHSGLDLLNLVCGGYMCLVGILFVIVGQRTAYKLKALRKSLYSEEELQAKFAHADLEGDGGLTLDHFRTLTVSLGLDMTRRETEAAYLHIKSTNSEKLTFAEFQAWWSDTEMEEEIDANAFSFV